MTTTPHTPPELKSDFNYQPGTVSPRVLPNPPEEAIRERWPVPSEYRALVDEVLNKSFQIEIIPKPDSPAFDFIIVVPDKYSTISDDYRKMYHYDRRVKVITYTDGTVGVRAFLQLVWSNFNPSIQAQIVADRLS